MTDLLARFAARSDLHQSPMHGRLMERIGWQVVGPQASHLFYRQLGPLAIAKIQRPKTIDLAWLKSFRRAHHTFTTYIEPGLTCETTGIKGLAVEPFAHSCTSLIDLSPTEQSILTSFSQKTRYNIVRTLKKDDLRITSTKLGKLSLAQKSAFFDLHNQWSRKKNVVGYPTSLLNAVLIAYAKSGDLHLCYKGLTLVGSLLILSHDSVATYYAAFATPQGYQSFAPTLLTWTAMQQAKSVGCDIFDFGGIYDPRYPRMYKNWVGFTKFKSGFHPTVVSYPPTTLKLYW